jgi:hypothetical protein
MTADILCHVGFEAFSQHSCRYCAKSVGCMGDCFVPRSDEVERIPPSLQLPSLRDPIKKFKQVKMTVVGRTRSVQYE